MVDFRSVKAQPISGYDLAKSIFSECGGSVVDELVNFVGGETDWLEFKAGLFARPKDLKDGERQEDALWHVARAVFGFLNSSGGLIVLGIDDTRQPVDLRRAERGETLVKEGMEAYLRTVVVPNLPPRKKKWNTGKDGQWTWTGKSANRVEDAVEIRPARYHGCDVVLVFVKPLAEGTMEIVRHGDRQTLLVRRPGAVAEVESLVNVEDIDSWLHRRRKITTEDFAEDLDRFKASKKRRIQPKNGGRKAPEDQKDGGVRPPGHHPGCSIQISIAFAIFAACGIGLVASVNRERNYVRFDQSRVIEHYNRVLCSPPEVNAVVAVENGNSISNTGEDTNDGSPCLVQPSERSKVMVSGAVAREGIKKQGAKMARSPWLPVENTIDPVQWKSYLAGAKFAFQSFETDEKTSYDAFKKGLTLHGSDGFESVRRAIPDLVAKLTPDEINHLVESAARDNLEKNPNDRHHLKDYIARHYLGASPYLENGSRLLPGWNLENLFQSPVRKLAGDGKTFETELFGRLSQFADGLPELRGIFPAAIQTRMRKADQGALVRPPSQFPDTLLQAEQIRISRTSEAIVGLVRKWAAKEIAAMEHHLDAPSKVNVTRVRALLVPAVEKELKDIVSELENKTIADVSKAAKRAVDAHLDVGNKLYKAATAKPPELKK